MKKISVLIQNYMSLKYFMNKRLHVIELDPHRLNTMYYPLTRPILVQDLLNGPLPNFSEFLVKLIQHKTQ